MAMDLRCHLHNLQSQSDSIMGSCGLQPLKGVSFVKSVRIVLAH